MYGGGGKRTGTCRLLHVTSVIASIALGTLKLDFSLLDENVQCVSYKEQVAGLSLCSKEVAVASVPRADAIVSIDLSEYS